MTKRWLWIAAVAAFGTPAGAQVEQSVRGEPDHFGPGFTNLYETRVEFRLLRPGHAVLLWVKPLGELEVYWPIRSGDRSERKAGRHAISTAEIASPIQAPVISGTPTSTRSGQFQPRGTVLSAAAPDVPGDTVTGYWVLVVLDAPITAPEIQKRLALMSHEGGASAVLERIAPLLIPDGVTWAMYSAAVVVQ
ncbi:MAG TPA: hypothetical protein VJ755_00945 [Gemmatimonadales bacterium]|nr:hypothetical protein [Gemmatimonadales bacterium]